MKSLLTTLVALQLSFLTYAQDSVKKKEAGIVFSSFNNFGATFRTGNSKSMWRYSAFIITGNNTKTIYDNINGNTENYTSSFGSQISFGREFRKNINEKFQIRYGADLLAGYGTLKNNNTNTVTSDFNNYKTNGYNFGFDIVIGGNYILTDNFLLGLELLPYVQYRNGSIKQDTTNGSTQNIDYSGISYGLSSSSVLLSLVYRW